MKKIVSLLLIVMMVLGSMSFTAMASTDTQVNPTIAENDIEAGNLGITGNAGFSTNAAGNVVVIEDESDATNKIFNIIADGSGHSDSSVLCNRLTSGTNLFATSEMNRFSANVKLPTVEDVDAVTSVFIPRGKNGYTTSAATEETFGVRLTKGGAQYYDLANATWVNFIADGTMDADKWYHIEAIMDNRETKLDGNKTYMNAFVYDVDDNNKLIGTSNWQYVSNAAPYSSAHCSFLSVQIQAYQYDAESVVSVDEFNVYKVTELPTYSVGIGEAETNKYITTPSGWLTSSGSESQFRSVGEWFTTTTTAANALISAESANKAVRVEMSVRFPELPTTMYNTYNLLKFDNQIRYKGSNSEVFDGTVHITNSGLEVLSYSSSTGKYDTAVELSNNAKVYPINANQWYNIVWDIDFTTFSAPMATITVKDESGNELVKTPSSYTAAPLITNNWNQSMILYAGVTNKDKVVHIDNTKVYGATSLSNLDNADSRTVAINEDFEVYDNDLYAVGASYNALVAGDSESHKAKSVTSLQSGIVIAQESLPVDTFVDGTEFNSTEPLKLTFTYNNPVPVANINTTNIEFYADDVKMSSGYTVAYDTTAVDANNCVTEFTVTLTELAYTTDYKITLKGELSDYNEALSGGVPADSGVSKDITFSIGEKIPDLAITPSLVDDRGVVIESTTLTSGQKVIGKASLTNNIDSQITCYIITAIYEGTDLVDVEISEVITVPAGQTVSGETAEIAATANGQTAKMFVWSNMELMKPLMIPHTLPAAE